MSNSNMEIKICKCKMCGKDFECTHRRKYCGDECKREARLSKLRVPKVTKKCEWCGKEFKGNNDYRIKFCSKECQQTSYSRKSRKYGPMDKRLEELKLNKEKRLIERQKEIEARKIARTVTKTCKWCGDDFTTDIPNKLTCSEYCSRKRSYKKRDKRINRYNTVDNDISLPRLYKRDQGICYLCHSKTDPTDIVRYPTYVIAGPRYPTIEHVIPIAKGGLHAWDNIKLACKQCNSTKSDSVDERELEEYLNKNKVTKRAKPKTKGKRVSQYTKDGRLIATYDSTVEAEKKTNLKCKGIQNCARGERKSHGGFVWRYV